MKKVIYILLFLTTLSLTWTGCSDDDKSDNYQYRITTTFRYMYKNGIDSVVSSFGISSFFLDQYKKQSEGDYKVVETIFAPSSPEFRKDKNGKYFNYGTTGANAKSGKIYYDFDYDTEVITYYDILPNESRIDLYPITLKWKCFDEEMKLPGTWYITSEIDSTLLSFEGNKYKQYVFLKENPTPVSYINGSYSSYGNGYYWKGEFIGQDRQASVTTPLDTFKIIYKMLLEANKDVLHVTSPSRMAGKYIRWEK